MTFGKRARCGLSRYPSESWDLWRQAPFHEALGPSFRWGDEKDRIPPGFGHQRRPGSIPTAAWPLCPDHGKFLPFGYRPRFGRLLRAAILEAPMFSRGPEPL